MARVRQKLVLQPGRIPDLNTLLNMLFPASVLVMFLEAINRAHAATPQQQLSLPDLEACFKALWILHLQHMSPDLLFRLWEDGAFAADLAKPPGLDKDLFKRFLDGLSFSVQGKANGPHTWTEALMFDPVVRDLGKGKPALAPPFFDLCQLCGRAASRFSSTTT